MTDMQSDDIEVHRAILRGHVLKYPDNTLRAGAFGALLDRQQLAKKGEEYISQRRLDEIELQILRLWDRLHKTGALPD